MGLPISLRIVYSLNAATFSLSSLALLSIVNTRVGIPAVYLPAYGAISFLPYSLRPIFAWISSLLLNGKKMTKENSNRHDKLMFPVLLLASLTFVGTTFIPSSEGIILCFFWGFVRGVAGAWNDFLLGMTVIEYSQREVNDVIENYEHVVSVNTAQSSTAKNIGSFISSIATLLFISKDKHLGDTVVNTLLLGTSAVFLLASLTSLKYQLSIEHKSASSDLLNTSTIHNCDNIGIGSVNNTSVHVRSDEPEPTEISLPMILTTNDNELEPITIQQQQILEVSSLVAFQMLLAVSALQKPIIAISSQTIWLSSVITLVIVLIFIPFLGCRDKRKQRSTRSNIDRLRSHRHQIPHRKLNLYFLLRYSMPIASYLIYSYYFTAFESEPMFLQSLSVLQTAIGSVATYVYEKLISPHCHSGWPLMGLIASLDILMGLVALLDVWVIRYMKKNEVFGDEDNVAGSFSIDNRLRCMVIIVGMVKYFVAELDYMPAVVLSTTNVDSDCDKLSERVDDGNLRTAKVENDPDDNIECSMEQEEEENVSLSDLLHSQNVASLSIDMLGEDEDDTTTPQIEAHPISGSSMYSTGMQYASFLSCIDFGAQIGDWITVPIVASLGITRENHWEHLDQFVVICSIFRMVRVVFLWLICPNFPGNSNQYSNINNSNG